MRSSLCLALSSTCILAFSSFSTQADTSTNQCLGNPNNFSEVLNCYKQEQHAKPLLYVAKGVEVFPGVEKRRFELSSQHWSPEGRVSPEQWKHDVDIYIPQNAARGQAVLVANNGTNIPASNKTTSDPTDFTQAMALEVARKTGTIVISLSNIPNQYLIYADDGLARTEDSSVAHSWKLFLENPEARPYLSAHVPMMAALVKTMDLAQKELAPWQVERFIASGVSKRAWAAWLSAIADERVNAVVPFVIDGLNTERVFEHTLQTFGKNWPLAFYDYYAEGILRQRHSENFKKLMKVVDPLTYLDSAYADRLAIPKYVVNASSDDFFAPDNSGFYFDQLPGPKSLRIAPNSSHGGIRQFVENSLISVVNRWQQERPLPTIQTRQTTGNSVSLQFSEAPIQVTQWTAVNPLARDFRDACGVRYEPRHISPSTPLSAQIQIAMPEQGWTATFVEATFADGFVATTPVTITPDRYPTSPPPETGPLCKTLPDLASR
ncbi:PhoPQ-activated pathogenicity-related family protein [Pseudomonas vancouverensis]|uniref:PhoPQ-regulated protein n=1 Tax=Pseudomonas vancouverensis TaxID=95300 RepID=A0A1H2PB69_PSEVA|nr:PhoPQ-activated protein PqaA family protein [Pseudomonas vancouverensis]KAB0490065.1 PhoPQ-regulated protein [Pseudomonas vancouverensis]TDB58831.1 PhoPQ-regulated protein [Pseudomonas vancouverensis]SDV14226.1 PhoPQ-activated pathogenicity-related protein [Pseudomonas vancouverensis]